MKKLLIFVVLGMLSLHSNAFFLSLECNDKSFSDWRTGLEKVKKENEDYNSLYLKRKSEIEPAIAAWEKNH